jgi:hypothetical protein
MSKHTAAAAVIGVTGLLVASAGTAVAGHSRFTDGPFGAHESGIHFVAEAGITSGCNSDGTNYCPGAPVSRAQMATFMRRLAGQAEGVAPSVNAATVEGVRSGDLQRRITGGCERGFSIRAVSPSGTVTCDDQQASVVEVVTVVQGFGQSFCPQGYVATGGGYIPDFVNNNSHPYASLASVTTEAEPPHRDSYAVSLRNLDGSSYTSDVAVTVRCVYGNVTFESSARAFRASGVAAAN